MLWSETGCSPGCWRALAAAAPSSNIAVPALVSVPASPFQPCMVLYEPLTLILTAFTEAVRVLCFWCTGAWMHLLDGELMDESRRAHGRELRDGEL